MFISLLALVGIAMGVYTIIGSIKELKKINRIEKRSKLNG